MKRVGSVLAAVLLAWLLITGSGPGSVLGGDKKVDTDKIVMIDVKLKDLVEKHIAAQKGKVVVIDMWGFFCPPCKKEFPNLVRLHHTYSAKGLVCMSLSFDYNEKLKKQAVGFLKEKGAVFANYCLDEKPENANKVWNFEAVPAVVVYDRQGKVAKIFSNDDAKKDPYTYAEVEELVKKLL